MTIPSIKPKSSIAVLPNDALSIVFAYVGERGAIPRVCMQWERVFDSLATTYQILWAINNNSAVSRLLSREIKKALKKGSKVISDTRLRKEVQQVYELIVMRIAGQGSPFLAFLSWRIAQYARERLQGDPEIALALRFSEFQREVYEKTFPKGYDLHDNSWRVYANEQRKLLQPLEYVLNNPKFWIYVVSRYPEFLSLASPRLQDDTEVVKAAITKNLKTLQYASDRLKNDPKIWIQIVLPSSVKHPEFFSFASDSIRDDKKVILKAIEIRFWENSLQHASDRLKDDPKIVKAAIMQSGFNLEWASPRFKDDLKTVKAAIAKSGGFPLQHASHRLKNVLEIVKAAVMKNGFALYHASPRLQDHLGIVEAAVTQDPSALECASPRLRDHVGIVKTAMRKDPRVLKYASNRLQKLFSN